MDGKLDRDKDRYREDADTKTKAKKVELKFISFYKNTLYYKFYFIL